MKWSVLQIIDMINTNEVVIIHGPTGCGKTTQVPQFILDDCRRRNQPCSVIVTQPRRIAAISVARRVCEERQWSLGTVCGYQVIISIATKCHVYIWYKIKYVTDKWMYYGNTDIFTVGLAPAELCMIMFSSRISLENMNIL